MNVVIINVCAGCYSTGKIASLIANEYVEKGDNCVIAYGQSSTEKSIPTYKIGGKLDFYKHILYARLFDRSGFGSKKATADFLEFLDTYQPDVIWLHNLHGYYINIEMLFTWIKNHPNIEVKWTLHDCWAFTGHCSYFTAAKCDKWKKGCHNCPQKKAYPTSYFADDSKRNYNRKKIAFNGVKNLTIVTPSKWLADLVKQSFLHNYDVVVKYNTIDTDVFKVRPSDFRKKYGLDRKKIILGVASPWSERKGLNDFVEMSKRLPSEYKIVLVGLDRKKIASLPQEIIGLEKTHSAVELAEIYSAVDVFVNPTYEDNYPTTNLEASACGIPVVTYRTGGSPESVKPENVVEVGDIDGILNRIKSICENS